MLNIAIRSGSISEGASIVEMLNYAFSEDQGFLFEKRDMNWWKWTCEKNPFGSPLITLAESKDGKIAGVQISWPFGLVYAGHKLTGYNLICTSVHPDFRGFGLQSGLTNYSAERAIKSEAAVVYGFPNQNSLHGFLKFYYKVYSIKWWIKILNPLKLISKNTRKLSGKSIDLPETYYISEEQLKRIYPINDFEKRIQIATSIDYLRWRYIEHPFYKYGIVFDRSKGTSCAIFLIRETSNEYREMIVLEMFGPVKQYRELLTELINTAKTLKVSMIAIMDSKDFQASEVFKKKRFLKANNKLFFTIPTRLELEPIISDIANWRMVAGLHDSV